jgi:ergothioneine biosynthesis protein EgtB
MRARIEAIVRAGDEDAAATIGLGLNHEQQHQELLLTDILHAFSRNALRPAYVEGRPARGEAVRPLAFVGGASGVVEIGHDGSGFSFDNEGPAHRVFLEPHALADRLSTNDEYAAFVADDGYRRPDLWLSEGWARVEAEGWTAPIYWERERSDSGWLALSLHGLAPLEGSAPVCHLSYFEADAFARWSKARLPTEAEWESAARRTKVAGNLLEGGALRPLVDRGEGQSPRQLFGDVWEWTSSAYAAYPGFQPAKGAIGEYNGKFMVNQQVLRGGSFATPASHLRATYRNFFPTHARWQFAGVRLARSG